MSTAMTIGMARHAAELAKLRNWGTAARERRQQPAAPARDPKTTGETFSLELAPRAGGAIGMNARRFPRTTEEAFGPYHRSSQCHIEPMGGSKPRTRPADWALYIVGAVGVVVAIVFNNLGA